jgi:flavin-dependent dehydrogenase
MPIMQPERFDAIVVGGGPAGCATALTLQRQRLSAVVLERSFYGDVRLGETVPPEICSPLRELGIWERFLAAGHRPCPAYVSAWGSDRLDRRDFLFSPWGEAWHLDRSRFDALLADAAADAGALVLRGTHAGAAAHRQDVWHVAARTGNGPLAVQGSYLVDATGRAASLVRKLGGRCRQLDRLVGVAAYLDLAPEARLDDAVLLEAGEDGWWYSARLPGARAVAAFLTDPPCHSLTAAQWWARLARTLHTGGRLCGSGRPPRSLIVRPADTRFAEPPDAPRFLAVGDAAAAFDPLSSQGILKALRSGLRAGEAIAADHAGEPGALGGHRARTAEELASYLDLRASYYRIENRWPESPFWRRRTSL